MGSMPETRFVDPSVGIILGRAWGSKTDAFLLDHPEAPLLRDEGDIQEYQLPEPLEIGGLDVGAVFQFRLDELIAVQLHLPDGLDPHEPEHLAALERFVHATGAWFTEPFEAADEGLLVVEEADTRMSIDLLDRVVVLEDLDA